MKKQRFHSFLRTFFILASLASFIYLKNLPAQQSGGDMVIETSTRIVPEDEKETRILLPDIELAKKIIDLTRLFLYRN